MLGRRSSWIAFVSIAMTAVIVTVVALTTVSGAPAIRHADKIQRVPKNATESLGYVAFLPPSSPAEGEVSTIVNLHGRGERGRGSEVDLNILMTGGLPRLAATHALTADAAQFLILAPQTDDE